MMSLQTYVNQSRHTLRKWSVDPRLHVWAKNAAHVLAGFCLSAASLGNLAQPLCLGLVCALRGWPAVLAAIGGCIGYPVFWDSAGNQGLIWLALGLLTVALDVRKLAPGLLPAISGVITAVSGLVFQFYGADDPPFLLYLLRIGTAAGSTYLFSRVLSVRDPLSQWFTWFALTLACAQIAPASVLCLGFLMAGALMIAAPFPAAALAGLALDLAQITPVPMTGVLALGYMLRFLPRMPKWLAFTGPGCVYLAVMALTGKVDLTPLPGLMVGGLGGTFISIGSTPVHRRGQTGAAQVRLELASGVLAQTQQLLMEVEEAPVDEKALIQRTAERTCNGCSFRKSCRERKKLVDSPTELLHKPLVSTEELPVVCKKSGRFLAELHRCQEQLRSIQADRQLKQEYRSALIQQYGFLSNYLQEVSDNLSSRETGFSPAFKPEIRIFGNRPEPDNGDQCLRFPGMQGKYYVILCDGMGTGIGAVQEGRSASMMLRKLLTAGFPTAHALKSLNSLCALRNRAGAVTVDLAELNLRTGRVHIYKWGAMPSYLVSADGAQRIGSVTPPPGLSVTEQREQSHRIALKHGEMLVLISDGAHDEETLRRCTEAAGRSPGQLGKSLMSHCRFTAADDATAVIIRLLPV